MDITPFSQKGFGRSVGRAWKRFFLTNSMTLAVQHNLNGMAADAWSYAALIAFNYYLFVNT